MGRKKWTNCTFFGQFHSHRIKISLYGHCGILLVNGLILWLYFIHFSIKSYLSSASCAILWKKISHGKGIQHETCLDTSVCALCFLTPYFRNISNIHFVIFLESSFCHFARCRLCFAPFNLSICQFDRSVVLLFRMCLRFSIAPPSRQRGRFFWRYFPQIIEEILKNVCLPQSSRSAVLPQPVPFYH